MEGHDPLAMAIEHIVAEIGGTVGVAVRDVARSRALDINPDVRFPSASVIKVPILVELLARAEEGGLSLDDRARVSEADKVPGSGVLRMMHEGLELTLGDLAHLMITISDNTASNMLIDRLGCDRINARMEGLGLVQTRLQRKFYDFPARDRGLDNWASARELADLLLAIERRQVVSRDACERILEIMRKQQFTHKLPALLPPDTQVASKTGSITGVSHDIGVIYCPAGPLVLVVLTRGIAEPSVSEGGIRHIARLVYHHWGTPA